MLQERINLPLFISALDQGHPRNWPYEIDVINAANLSTINITPKAMFSTGTDFELRPAFLGDLHDSLKYQDIIFFSLNNPDSICIKMLENPVGAVGAFETLNPDVLSGFDADFYADTPTIIVLQRLLSCYRANLYLADLGKPVIPIFYPMLPHFFNIQDMYLDAVKAHYIAIPLFNIYNLNRDHRLKKLRELILAHATYLARTRGIIPIFLNASPRLKLRGINYCCSSHTWRVYPRSYMIHFKSLNNYFPELGHLSTSYNHRDKEISKLQKYNRIMRNQCNKDNKRLF